MLKNEKSANRIEHQNQKTEVFWHKNQKTDQKSNQNRKTENPNAPLYLKTSYGIFPPTKLLNTPLFPSCPYTVLKNLFTG